MRLLRSERIDARYFSAADIDAGLLPGADPDGVAAIAFLVSAYPSPERGRADSIGVQLQELLPQANLIKIFCPGIAALESVSDDHRDSTVNSLAAALEICMAWHQARIKGYLSPGYDQAYLREMCNAG